MHLGLLNDSVLLSVLLHLNLTITVRFVTVFWLALKLPTFYWCPFYDDSDAQICKRTRARKNWERSHQYSYEKGTTEENDSMFSWNNETPTGVWKMNIPISVAVHFVSWKRFCFVSRSLNDGDSNQSSNFSIFRKLAGQAEEDFPPSPLLPLGCHRKPSEAYDLPTGAGVSSVFLLALPWCPTYLAHATQKHCFHGWNPPISLIAAPRPSFRNVCCSVVSTKGRVPSSPASTGGANQNSVWQTSCSANLYNQTPSMHCERGEVPVG